MQGCISVYGEELGDQVSRTYCQVSLSLSTEEKKLMADKHIVSHPSPQYWQNVHIKALEDILCV